MARPKLLLLDEPSMGLAPIFVDKIFEIILEINGQARRSCSSSRTRSWRSTQQAGDTFSRPGRSPWRTTRRRCARTSRFARRISARTSPLKEVLADIERWRGRGDRVALATVVATRRPPPGRSAPSWPSPRAGRSPGPSRAAASSTRCTKKRRTCWRTARRSSSRTASRTSRPGTPDFPAAGRSTSSLRRSTTTSSRGRRTPTRLSSVPRS